MFGRGVGLGGCILLFNLALIGLGIYSMILFIKLARRGIQALDIYVDNNRKDKQI